MNKNDLKMSHKCNLLTKESLAELAVAADKFNTRPLRRFMQPIGHYQMLNKGEHLQIKINTDTNIKVHDTLITEVSSTIESVLKLFSEHISRVEIHLSDENSDKKKGINHLRCMIEARLEGRRPIAVTHQAEKLDDALDGAVDKLRSMIESTLGRLKDHKKVQANPHEMGAK